MTVYKISRGALVKAFGAVIIGGVVGVDMAIWSLNALQPTPANRIFGLQNEIYRQKITQTIELGRRGGTSVVFTGTFQRSPGSDFSDQTQIVFRAHSIVPSAAPDANRPPIFLYELQTQVMMKDLLRRYEQATGTSPGDPFDTITGIPDPDKLNGFRAQLLETIDKTAFREKDAQAQDSKLKALIPLVAMTDELYMRYTFINCLENDVIPRLQRQHILKPPPEPVAPNAVLV